MTFQNKRETQKCNYSIWGCIHYGKEVKKHIVFVEKVDSNYFFNLKKICMVCDIYKREREPKTGLILEKYIG